MRTNNRAQLAASMGITGFFNVKNFQLSTQGGGLLEMEECARRIDIFLIYLTYRFKWRKIF